MKYTHESIEKTMQSLNELEEIMQNKIKRLGILKIELTRIQLALKDNLKTFLMEELKKETEIQLQILKSRGRFSDSTSDARIVAKNKAKIVIMKKYRTIDPTNSYITSGRWEDFLFIMTTQWKKDREKLKKEGKIQ